MATETRTFETVTAQADRILAGIELPPEVRSISTDIGEDASGDMALFVHLQLVKGYANKPAEVRRVADVSEQIQISLLENGITYFPYVFVDEAA